MLQNDKKKCFIELGLFLSQFSKKNTKKNNVVKHNDLFFDEMLTLIETSKHHNGWFTEEQVFFALQSWAEALQEDKLNQWLASYTFTQHSPKTIALILAGNIPLVGFHDLISVILSGHKALVKLSSNDQKIVPFLVRYLIQIDDRMAEFIEFTESKLENFDAVIATGSNNTARYFEYYFRNKPSIVRKNRNSVAILTGNETQQELELLGEDIFRYFGLGCRNVSKLFVPKGYQFDTFFNAIYTYKEVIEYEKYANNYDYNKAVFLMSLYQLLDNGFLTLKEDESYSSPISSVFYEYYESLDTLKIRLNNDHELLQCIVSNQLIENSIPFGKTQQPQLWDYADGIDTMQFLISL